MGTSQGVASATGMRKSLRRTFSAPLAALLVVLLFVPACATGSKAAKEPASATASAPQMSPQRNIVDKSLGLDKNDVFAMPDPISAPMAGGEPGENDKIAAYFEGAPPPIPHRIEEFLPIRAGENQCLDCHDDPASLGSPVAAGDPTPIPATHYTDLRRAPTEVTDALIGARFVCVMCHAPQHDALPLVENTYRQ